MIGFSKPGARALRNVTRALIAALLVGLGVESAPRRMTAQDQISSNFPLLDWQPTRAQPGWHYTGSQVCATCHVTEAATQVSTPMAHALTPVADCQILRSHPNLGVRLGRFAYHIDTRDGRASYTVTDGSRSISLPLLYAVGDGVIGQTYVYQSGGAYYESQVSYFTAIQGLDLTLGHHREAASLEAAAGMRLDHNDAIQCFACHATAAVSRSGFQLARMTPGITCEGCHGPGAAHVVAMRSGKAQDLDIFNPGKLDPSSLVDFCGSCHRGALTVAASNFNGLVTVRFQSYRLTLSHCFAGSGERLSCLSCHNPHQPLETSAAYYDSKCLACHGPHQRPLSKAAFQAAACPVSAKNCVTCHMPKYELPGSHFKFTDHYIRVVHPGEAYPG